MERIQNNHLFSPLEVIVIDNKSISADLSNSDDDTTSVVDVEVKSNVRFFLGIRFILHPLYHNYATKPDALRAV